MAIDRESRAAVERALRAGVPFALYCLPEEEHARFNAARESRRRDPDTGICPDRDTDCGCDHECFDISPWLGRFSSRISVPAELTAAEALELPLQHTDNQPYTFYHGISEEEYCRRVTRIAERCRRRDGKTVYSRVLAGDNPDLDIAAAAEELFDRFPGTFRFLYYTPETGCWLGASPETLLDADTSRGTFSTAAFAGTRPINLASQPWDEKNLRENLFVADFFRERFTSLGLPYSISRPTTVDYGPVQHLCRDISGTLGAPVSRIIDAINPTPALCGTPSEEAIADISEFEPQPRLCYGGFVAVASGSRYRAFVNLRCARIAPDGRFNIYAGGGITALSDPRAEFRETTAKASVLLSILESRKRLTILHPSGAAYSPQKS